MKLLKVESNSFEVTGVPSGSKYQSARIVIRGTVAELHRSSKKLETKQYSEVGEHEEPQLMQEECSPGCLADAIGNGICDIECFVSACYQDGNDCANNDPNELDELLSEYCAPGCNAVEIGDGFCDAACNTLGCDFDDGDCELMRPARR